MLLFQDDAGLINDQDDNEDEVFSRGGIQRTDQSQPETQRLIADED